MSCGIWVLIANTDYFLQYPTFSCIITDSPKVGGYECLTFLDVQMLTCEGSGRFGLKPFIGSLHNLTVIYLIPWQFQGPPGIFRYSSNM